MTHYDIRIVCEKTGQLESTEDCWMTRRSAEYALAFLQENAPNTRYMIVECDAPGDSIVHDVDVAYFLHQREHCGDDTYPFDRMCGAPTFHGPLCDYPYNTAE